MCSCSQAEHSNLVADYSVPVEEDERNRCWLDDGQLRAAFFRDRTIHLHKPKVSDPQAFSTSVIVRRPLKAVYSKNVT